MSTERVGAARPHPGQQFGKHTSFGHFLRFDLSNLERATATGLPRATHQSPCVLLTLDEAAGHLRISKRSLQRLRAEGHLPATRIGTRSVVRREDLEAYVSRLWAAV